MNNGEERKVSGLGEFSLDGRECKNKSTSCVGGVAKEARELLK